ncbi:MAG: hypothetical protein GXY33_07085 [Phycisphaerae bacterium]|nr:hypothetical protein [Phycisphaerae bacterium]
MGGESRTSRNVLILLLLVGIAAAATLAVRFLFPPLPFAGPYAGTVVDADSGTPIADARVCADGWRHDNPLPDGSGHDHVRSETRTDLAGRFILPESESRGGWFGTDFAIEISAEGYIPAVSSS